jgi:hypothetical protein
MYQTRDEILRSLEVAEQRLAEVSRQRPLNKWRLSGAQRDVGELRTELRIWDVRAAGGVW